MAQRHTWLIIVGLTLVGVFAAICVLRTRGGSLPAGQESPQAVLRKTQRALSGGDRARFLECFRTTSQQQRAAVEALFDYLQTAYRLRDALRETYGKTAWETFVSLQATPAAFTAYLWPRDEDIAATADITIQGTEARAELPSQSEPLALRLRGVWRIEEFRPTTDVRLRRQFLARAAEALSKARDDIGKRGLKVEDLAREARRRMGAEP